uniref:Uncharacterized protein n=1 Tax=uncultured delta proteobacterium HF4000_08N17 TaxID=710836 RepID=E0XVH3_9DELT|nr:hypothetical protein [uncultured delta proteobacterium HF4000_08N17]
MRPRAFCIMSQRVVCRWQVKFITKPQRKRVRNERSVPGNRPETE